MQQDTILFKAGTVIEISFARIKEGKEPQLFGQYFPKVMPILNELGGQSLGSFAVTESLSELDEPQMSALFQWPSLEAFEALHTDPRFLEIKGIRDDALVFLSNGHFFSVKEDTEVTFIEGQFYGLTTTKHTDNSGEKDNRENSSLISFDLVQSSKQDYQLESAKISSWSEQTQQNLLKPASTFNVFKIQRNFLQ
ncbi:MAG: hypothetical protein V7785_07070 [Bermanella sp.]